MNASAGAIYIDPLLMWDTDTPVRDLHFFYLSDKWYLFIATNTGIVYAPYSSIASGGFTPVNSDILGTFDITKIFEYSGNLGMFAKNNGLIYGPFPKP